MGESIESGVESMFESPFPPYGLCDSGKSRNLSGPIYSLVKKKKKNPTRFLGGAGEAACAGIPLGAIGGDS